MTYQRPMAKYWRKGSPVGGQISLLVGLAVFYAITYLFVRYLEKQGVYIKV